MRSFGHPITTVGQVMHNRMRSTSEFYFNSKTDTCSGFFVNGNYHIINSSDKISKFFDAIIVCDTDKEIENKIKIINDYAWSKM